MKRIRKLLFFGELPHNSVHGISIENSLNLKMLESSFVIDRVEDKGNLKEYGRITVNKTFVFIRNIFVIISKSVLHKYDYLYLVFSLSSFGSLKSLAAIIIFRIFNRGKIVLHIHRGDFFSRYYTVAFNRTVAKLAFSLSHKVIVLSETQKTEFESSFKRQFLVLANTIEIESEHVDRCIQKKKFIYLSNYLIDKGIIDLLEVFKKLAGQNNEITLKTFGQFSDIRLEETILKYNSSNISINDPVSGMQKYREISHSDCLILPSWNEGQPVVLLEAMSVGTPIIASKVGLIPELLGNDYQFLTNPGDRYSLESKIIEFLAADDINDISIKLRNCYNEQYSQKIHFEHLNIIFR